ncbi:putative bifunctional lysylphosphatidylglycerol flippase/synthetase [Ensifer soli]|uniref:UPF0104 family protein n=1 Tax=Ciceribacter sp. sgz301302 TaxID=3342379 RepID=UPI0035BAE39A
MALRLALRLVVIVAICVAVYLLYDTLKEYSAGEVLAALGSISAGHLALGLAFAACSYLCLGGFDALAVRYAGKPLAFHKTALASFVSLSIGHNVGVAALSSGAVRYRFYSRWGLTTEDVAKVILFCGVTVALGLSTMGAIGLMLRPDDATRMIPIGPGGIRMLALVCALVPVAYVALAATLRTPLRFRTWSFALPSAKLAVGQVLIGTLNFAFVAASLHQMLSALAEAGYLKVVAVSIIANVAAIVSHVPGGIGVLEATVTHILPGASSVAAVIAFRVVYYFIPLFIGLPTLLLSEWLITPRKDATSEKRGEPRAHGAGAAA